MNSIEINELRNKLIEKAKEELINNPNCIQVTLFETTSGKTMPFFLYDLKEEENEEKFFKELKDSNKCKINHVLAMWRDNTIDIPKRSILQKIYKLDEDNANTCVLMLSDNGICGFRLAKLL